MSYLAKARLIKPGDFAIDLATKDFSKATWSPKMFVLHNTGVPTLSQWLSGGTTPARRLENLRTYYQGMGWHSGPHWFVAPDGIWEFCDPLQDGVHCSCANHVAFGCEMVGDFATESFSAGPGAQVRDNAVEVVAAVFSKFGWSPDPLVLWERGLAFHQDCQRDHHQCPGKNVTRPDFVARVLKAMGVKVGLSAGTPATQAPKTAEDQVRWAQSALNQLGADPRLVVDGDLGPKTQAALRLWQASKNLAAGGQLTPVTLAALERATRP